MLIMKLYEYWDSEKKQTVRSRIPKDELTDLKLFTIIADAGKYLYHKESGAVRASITIPVYLFDKWEERAY